KAGLEILDDDAVVPPGQGLPGFQLDGLCDGANTAVTDGDVRNAVHAAQPREPAEAGAADVGLFVVDAAVAAEGALEEAAVHPAAAAVPGDVLVVLPVLRPGLRLDAVQGVLLEQHVLPAQVRGLHAAVPLEGLAGHQRVARAVGDIRDPHLGVAVEDAV